MPFISLHREKQLDLYTKPSQPSKQSDEIEADIQSQAPGRGVSGTWAGSN